MRSIIRRSFDRPCDCLFLSLFLTLSLRWRRLSTVAPTRSDDCVDNDLVAPTGRRGSMKTLWKCSSALLSAERVALGSHRPRRAVNASMEPPLSSRGVLMAP